MPEIGCGNLASMQKQVARTILAALGLLLNFIVSAPAQDGAWTPDGQTIGELEAAYGSWKAPWPMLNMPDPKPDIAAYARFYAGIMSGGRRMISAEFVKLGSYVAGVHVVSSPRDFPQIMDGGCGVITIQYDADAKRIQSLKCNGLA